MQAAAARKGFDVLVRDQHSRFARDSAEQEQSIRRLKFQGLRLSVLRRRYRCLIDRAVELDPKLGAAYFARAMWGDDPHDIGATSDNPLIVARARLSPGQRT